MGELLVKLFFFFMFASVNYMAYWMINGFWQEIKFRVKNGYWRMDYSDCGGRD